VTNFLFKAVENCFLYKSRKIYLSLCNIIIIEVLKSFLIPGIYEAGCDEAGRGCLAGPVFAAAVILPGNYAHPDLNDSKQLTAELREILRNEIEKVALSWAVAWVDNHKIDQMNILRASILAMHEALDKLTIQPKHILVDGNRFYPYKSIPYSCIIKGDGIYASIAAASVLAKTWRDRFMNDLHHQHDVYAWNSNKGYPTREHRAAIQKHGISAYHRKSFALIDDQLECDF
jgi:ribonuclease HII